MIKWEEGTVFGEALELIGSVPVQCGHGPGTYTIHCVRRPRHCDRGDWLIHVEVNEAGDIDGQDGFPRYFFGNKTEVKKQMETWAHRRRECQSAQVASAA
jgi:hypothetical protein